MWTVDQIAEKTESLSGDQFSNHIVSLHPWFKDARLMRRGTEDDQGSAFWVKVMKE
ncbi:hypothetical protein HanPSC8_Chr01g0018871 [Helianthus annuus]|nr:hypothetical protein HanPSC8_Chr01g0018871 [Helianthus annuus]